jgi:hypothetical protein
VSVHRHTVRTLAPDYARSAAGLALAGGPLPFLSLAPVPAWILAALAALFAAHGLRTALRQATRVVCDADGIEAHGLGTRRIPWNRLRALRLRHFSTRRDGAGGWMQLVLRGPACTIRVESTIVGFEEIVSCATVAARVGGLDLPAATLGNLDVLGLSSKFTRPSAATDARSVECQRS